MVTTKLTTVEEFEQMPDDGFGYEIVRGELRRMPAGGVLHGVYGGRFLARLFDHVEERQLGVVTNSETGFVLWRGPDVMYMPDVAFISAERLATMDDPNRIARFVPDLLVEVVSPSDRMSEVIEKMMDYLDAGVRLVWVAVPKRRVVIVYGPDRLPREFGVDDVLDGGEVLPDFRLAVADIFRT